jgi:hypothetical protein
LSNGDDIEAREVCSKRVDTVSDHCFPIAADEKEASLDGTSLHDDVRWNSRRSVNSLTDAVRDW